MNQPVSLKDLLGSLGPVETTAEQIYTRLMIAVMHEPSHRAVQVFACTLRDWIASQSLLTPSQREELREVVLALAAFGDRLEEEVTLRTRPSRRWWRFW